MPLPDVPFSNMEHFAIESCQCVCVDFVCERSGCGAAGRGGGEGQKMMTASRECVCLADEEEEEGGPLSAQPEQISPGVSS